MNAISPSKISKEGKSVTPFLSDVTELRRRARKHIEGATRKV